MPGVATDLDRLLGEFAGTEAARACAEPEGAYANCLAVSVLCAGFLRANGIACGLLHLTGCRTPSSDGAAGRWPFCDAAGIEHWTVRTGRWSIDWTARQFGREAQWPLVEPVEALRERWRSREEWACDSCADLAADERHVQLAPAALHREHRTIGRATRGRGPFPDPRHDATPALVLLCACDQPSAPQNRIAATAMT
jgi:hypothetical protein